MDACQQSITQSHGRRKYVPAGQPRARRGISFLRFLRFRMQLSSLGHDRKYAIMAPDFLSCQFPVCFHRAVTPQYDLFLTSSHLIYSLRCVCFVASNRNLYSMVFTISRQLYHGFAGEYSMYATVVYHSLRSASTACNQPARCPACTYMHHS